MKKNLITIIISMLILSSCADDKTFYSYKGKEITKDEYNIKYHRNFDNGILDTSLVAIHADVYGWANSETSKNDKVIYEVNAGNIVWSIILSETIIAPVVFTGWYLFEPKKLK